MAAGAGLQGGFRPAIRVGRARCPATGIPEEWPSSLSKQVDRTRLTGRLARYSETNRVSAADAQDEGVGDAFGAFGEGRLEDCQEALSGFGVQAPSLALVVAQRQAAGLDVPELRQLRQHLVVERAARDHQRFA